MLIAFELADHIHEVFENTRTRDGTVFGHVSHDEDGKILGLGGGH